MVWNTSGNTYEYDLLEKVQLYAARIITGLPILASRDSLYLETGLEPLVSRRMTAKLVTMYNVCNNEVPQYLEETIPSKWRQLHYSKMQAWIIPKIFCTRLYFKVELSQHWSTTGYFNKTILQRC
jgi:hypothetical protein